LLGGALLGLSFYALIQEVAQAPLPAAAYAYLGMSAFFAAAAKVPLATSIMVAEMGNNYLLIPPSLLASIVAREVSGNTSIYSSQLLHRPPREIVDAEALLAILREKGVEPPITAGQLADGGIKPVRHDTPAEIVLKLMEKGAPVVPVVDGDGRPIGVITPDSLEEAIEEGVDLPTTPAHTLAYMEAPVVGEEEGVDSMLEKMLTYESEAAIVVDKDGRYKGTVLIEEVIAALAYILQEAGSRSRRRRTLGAGL
ncbi:truncated ClcA homolog, partial [Aeropyrum pernix]